MKCPVCDGVQTGKVGVDQYYCWNCFVEFTVQKNGVEVFEVAEDGSLTAYSAEDEPQLSM